MIAKEIRRQYENFGKITYEKLIYGVLIKQRQIFIRLVEALITQLGNKDEKLSANFRFSHNINRTNTHDFVEVEIFYPAHYSALVKQCCEQAIMTIMTLSHTSDDYLNKTINAKK